MTQGDSELSVYCIEARRCAGGVMTLACASYFVAPVTGTGTRVPVMQLPLPELVPETRPEASRRVLVVLTPWVVSLPLRRPVASRNCVRLPFPENLLVLALPDMRPLASR